MHQWLNRIWYSDRNIGWLLLLPFSGLYTLLSWLHRYPWRAGILRPETLPVPLIVVGNITAGGAGKTPLVMWLAACLKEMGMRPGVMSRGYGGRVGKGPVRVSADMNPAYCGDEPAMMAGRLDCPVMVGSDRLAAAKELIGLGCDVLVADDGLQHHRLARDFEILVVDGRRGFGNGSRLPAGPLRESPKRTRTVDCVVVNGAGGGPCYEASVCRMKLVGDKLHRLDDSEKIDLDAWPRPVHAIAGIGNPGRFFNYLEQAGLTIERHAFADHFSYRQKDLEFTGDLAIVMTEKDAVKCRSFELGDAWYLPVRTQFLDDGEEQIRKQLNEMLCSHQTPAGE